jgi:hypothetical protein
VLDPTVAPEPIVAQENVPRTEENPKSELTRPAWTELINEGEWGVYQPAIRGVAATGIPLLLGGAFGLAAHTGRWRNTKDLDLYVLPEHHDRAVSVLNELGFEDYYHNENSPQKPQNESSPFFNDQLKMDL